MEVQETLSLLADPRNASQGATRSVHADRVFVKKAVAKYRQLISQYEAQKQVIVNVRPAHVTMAHTCWYLVLVSNVIP
jgi:hypothetical protein